MSTIREFLPYIAFVAFFVFIFGLLGFVIVNRPPTYTQQQDQNGNICFVPNDRGDIICMPR